jgi:ribonuclease T2
LRWLSALLLTLGLAAQTAHAEGEPPGIFDYYVLSLSWSPGWCELEGEARNSPQCGRDLGWVLHGLWPQYRRGYPSWCHGPMRDASRAETAAMADIMGTDGSAWHQWKKHGRCTGLAARDYFIFARRAYQSITLPPVFERIDRDITILPSVIGEAFLEKNPGIEPDMLSVTCAQGRIAEVRICLSRELGPRECGYDVLKGCSLTSATLDGK